MKYSIGYNFDKKLINYYKKINSKQNSIFEVFFSSKQGYLGGARYYDLPDSSLEDTEKHFKYLKPRIATNYLLNSSYCPNLKNKENLSKLSKYFDWVNSQNTNIVTVADKKILTILRDKYPKLAVNISIVMGLKTIKQVNELRQKYPNIKRITLHQSINRDKKLIEKHIKNAKKKTKDANPVEIELLANEICLYKCPKMKEHYEYNSKMSFKKMRKHRNVFESFCIEKRASNIIHFLNAPFIRPEDISLYEKMGVNIIKLSGREAPSEYLKQISKSYINKKHSGNIMNLFDPRYWPNNNPPFIKNKKLDGFLEYLWKNNLKKIESIPPKFNSIKYQ